MSRQNGVKMFDVRVCQTYVQHYQVPAKTAEEAEDIVSDRLQTGEYDPADEALAKYDVEVCATEIDPDGSM